MCSIRTKTYAQVIFLSTDLVAQRSTRIDNLYNQQIDLLWAHYCLCICALFSELILVICLLKSLHFISSTVNALFWWRIKQLFANETLPFFNMYLLPFFALSTKNTSMGMRNKVRNGSKNVEFHLKRCNFSLILLFFYCRIY